MNPDRPTSNDRAISSDGRTDHTDHTDHTYLDDYADYSDLEPGLSEREEKASRNRLIQIILGVFLIIVGIPMIPLAGPGWAVVLVGLNMVWPDNPLVPWLRRKLPVVPDEGPIPKRYYVIGGVLMVVGIVGSILWGDQVTSWFRDLVGI